MKVVLQNKQPKQKVDGPNTVRIEHRTGNFYPVIRLPTHLFIFPNIVWSPLVETSITLW